jgi:hypothetical protein
MHLAHSANHRISNFDKHPTISIRGTVLPLMHNKGHCLHNTGGGSGFPACKLDETQPAKPGWADPAPFRELLHIIIVTYQNCVVRLSNRADERIRRVGCNFFSQQNHLVAGGFECLGRRISDALIDKKTQNNPPPQFMPLHQVFRA